MISCFPPLAIDIPAIVERDFEKWDANEMIYDRKSR